MRLKTLNIFSDFFEAEVVRGRLNADGIDAFIFDNNVHNIIGPTVLNGYRLQVREEDFLKALNIYKKTLSEN